MKKITALLFALFFSVSIQAQLQPGFVLDELATFDVDAMCLQIIDDNTTIIGYREGNIKIQNDFVQNPQDIIDVQLVSVVGEGGLLSILYQKVNGTDYLWTYYQKIGNPREGIIDLYELDIENNTATFVNNIFTGFFNTAFNHLGGTLMWYNGYLFLTLGDAQLQSGWGSQRDSRDNGKIIRIDPFTGEGHPDNPLYNSSNPFSAESIQYAKGFRNTFRAVMNNGIIWGGDVGQQDREEINAIAFSGFNGGWPLYEAELTRNISIPINPDTGLVYEVTNDLPAISYTHDNSNFWTPDQTINLDFNGVSVVPLGVVENWGYNGSSLVVTDYFRNRLLLFDIDNFTEIINVRDIGTPGFDFISSGQIRNNEIYFIRYFGETYKLSYDETLGNPEYYFDKDLAKKTYFIIGTLPLVEEKQPKVNTPYLIKYELNNREQWERKAFTNYYSLPQH